MPGQTLAELRALLDRHGLTPRKRFGQNFLIDLNLMRKLVAAAELSPDDVIFEVGAGAGSLTEFLLESGARVVAVEIDRGLQAVLRERLAEQPRFTLIADDALSSKHRLCDELQARLDESASHPRKLVANLPYNIATPLIIELLRQPAPLTRLVVTIQKELGERLMADRGAAYGPASVIVQTLARVERIAPAPPTAFWPAPKVDSVMLRIDPLPRCDVPVDDLDGFSAFVHAAFGQRRKQIGRLLRSMTPADLERLERRVGVSRSCRPEAVLPATWPELYACASRPSADREDGPTDRS